MNRFVRLLHLVDSSIPTGSFAYSYGLESAITFGFVKNVSELKNYLYSFLQQAVSMELPFINSCFNLVFPDLDERLQTIIEEYDAMMLVPTLHRASVIQGKNWLRLVETLYPELGIEDINRWLSRNKLSPHYVIVLALCLKRIEFTLSDIHSMYLHMSLRDQISAAIRLGFIGSMEGHTLQHQFYDFFENLMKTHSTTDYHQATRSAFLLDTTQVFHEDIYSKLFQN